MSAAVPRIETAAWATRCETSAGVGSSVWARSCSVREESVWLNKIVWVGVGARVSSIKDESVKREGIKIVSRLSWSGRGKKRKRQDARKRQG